MGGYGWLIIIDHPQANLYSLYGHLSPSRWRMDPGPVEKGELIGYLGDSDENGGSAENPLVPHLHLGIRAGQRSDYPAKGEWRWMAGWIAPCPVDVGWLEPSALIASQDIPPGGFQEPNGKFVAKWGIELLFATIYLVSGFSLLIYTTRKNKPLLLVLGGAVMFLAGWIFYQDGWKISYLLFSLAPLLLGTGIYRLLRRTSFTESAHA
jgi:murein DD-endopeptidase MepM/ murein hydrolase activator NlpD